MNHDLQTLPGDVSACVGPEELPHLRTVLRLLEPPSLHSQPVFPVKRCNDCWDYFVISDENFSKRIDRNGKKYWDSDGILVSLWRSVCASTGRHIILWGILQCMTPVAASGESLDGGQKSNISRPAR